MPAGREGRAAPQSLRKGLPPTTRRGTSQSPQRCPCALQRRSAAPGRPPHRRAGALRGQGAIRRRRPDVRAARPAIRTPEVRRRGPAAAAQAAGHGPTTGPWPCHNRNTGGPICGGLPVARTRSRDPPRTTPPPHAVEAEPLVEIPVLVDPKVGVPSPEGTEVLGAEHPHPHGVGRSGRARSPVPRQPGRVTIRQRPNDGAVDESR